MRHPGRSSSALAVAASGVALALVVVACGGSASPSPAASAAPAASQARRQREPPRPRPTPTVGRRQPGGRRWHDGDRLRGPDQAGLGHAERGPLRRDGGHRGRDPRRLGRLGGISMQMKMEFAKPDKMRISAGMGGAGALFEMISVGKDSWIRMFGGDTWTKSDASPSPVRVGGPERPRLHRSTPRASRRSTSSRPGWTCPGPRRASSPTRSRRRPPSPAATATRSAQLGGATAFAVRVDTSTGRPQSMGFVIDPAKATPGRAHVDRVRLRLRHPGGHLGARPVQGREGRRFPLPSGLAVGPGPPVGITLP